MTQIKLFIIVIEILMIKIPIKKLYLSLNKSYVL